MQTFITYLHDIFMTTDIDTKPRGETITFSEWYDSLDTDTMMQYADDYAKDCMRVAREKIQADINKKTLETVEETGAYKYNFAYEECLEIVNNNLK